ncbi:MAG: hypothetical protein ABEH77_00550 [Halobacteriaceae archaeon]
MPEPALWTYAWSVYGAGGEAALADLADRGIESINLAAHYHSVETFDPKQPDRQFESYPAGCYFQPRQGEFADTPIDPLPNDVRGVEDPLADIVALADDQGLAVNAWTVCLHNTRLGVDNEAYRIETAYGQPRDHVLCPSNPEVRAYFGALAAAIADRGVAEIQLEKLGWPSPFHQHGRDHGHPKRQVLTSEVEEWLLGQCFCEACQERAADHGVDVAAARGRVRDLLADSFEDPHSDPPELGALLQSEPHLADLQDYRAAVVEELLAGIAAATPDDVDLSYYLMEWPGGFGVDDGWPSGVSLDALNTHLDRVKALCYVGDPVTARERVRAAGRALNVPVDAGVTLATDHIEREQQFHAVVDAIRDRVEKLSVYHHGLMTEAQLDWVDRAF